MVAFDNLSGLDGTMTDCLCRLATGDGFETRALYTGRDLDVFEAARPLLLTSIADAATRPDVLDRALLVRLRQRERRLDEEELFRAVEEVRARVLGALAFAAHVALTRLATTDVPSSIRMRAPARFAAAAEPALGLPEGAVVDAFLASRQQAIAVVAMDAVVEAIVDFPSEHAGNAGSSWTGTASHLLKVLNAKRGNAWLARNRARHAQRHRPQRARTSRARGNRGRTPAGWAAARPRPRADVSTPDDVERPGREELRARRPTLRSRTSRLTRGGRLRSTSAPIVRGELAKKHAKNRYHGRYGR